MGRARDNVCPVPPNGAEPRRTASDQSSPTPLEGKEVACEAAAAVILVQLCPPCVATTTPTTLPVLPVVAFEVSDNLSRGTASIALRLDLLRLRSRVSHARLAVHSCLCTAHVSGHGGVSNLSRAKT